MAKKQICKGDAFPMMAQSCYTCLITCLETKKMNYLTKWSKLVATLSFCMTISGCATLFTPKKTLTVHSYPEGAAVYGIRNNSEWQGQTDYLGTTPFEKKVSAAVKYLAFTKDGYETSFIKTKRKFNPVVLADIIYPLAFAFDVAKWNTFKQTEYTASLAKMPTVVAPPSVPSAPSHISYAPTAPKELYVPSYVLSEVSMVQSPTKMSKKDIIKKYDSAVFMVFTSGDNGTCQGSGFFVNSNGLAISNYHVFQGTDKGAEVIKTTNGNKYKVKEVLAYSEKYDYIVFRVDGSGFNYIPVTRQGYEKGDDVYAIGSPRGLENTFSEGMISAIRKERTYPIQINAPIDHGSSGGALINVFGQVIGITSAGRDDSGANLNFAQDIRVIFPY